MGHKSIFKAFQFLKKSSMNFHTTFQDFPKPVRTLGSDVAHPYMHFITVTKGQDTACYDCAQHYKQKLMIISWISSRIEMFVTDRHDRSRSAARIVSVCHTDVIDHERCLILASGATKHVTEFNLFRGSQAAMYRSC